jgi:hypothetical protein
MRCVTTLGYGLLFFLVDPTAKLGFVMCSRAMTETEWEDYRGAAGARKRRPGEMWPGDPIDDVRLEMQRLGPDETRAMLLDGTRKRIGSGKLWIPT